MDYAGPWAISQYWKNNILKIKTLGHSNSNHNEKKIIKKF
jgi:hypothetical protein